MVMPVEFVPFLFSLVLAGLSTGFVPAMPIKLPQRLTNQQALLQCIGRTGSRATGRNVTAV
jgi:hypothetical protein